MLSAFDLIAILLVLTAFFGWINHRFIRLPHTIGLLVMGLGASLFLIGVELALPDVLLYEGLAGVIRQIDFQATVLNGMLAFLLFAGVLHVNLSVLRDRALAVGSMATFGIVISTAIVGIGFWLTAGALGVPMPFAWALVFGALISPTDPIAVLSTLKAVRVPGTLEIDMTGESLFNDGVGVVIFTVLLTAAVNAASGSIDLLHVGELFFVEALGGAVLGLLGGYVAYRAMRAIDDYPIEVLISLALVTVRGDNQDERTASIRMRMRRGWADGGRAKPDRRQSNPGGRVFATCLAVVSDRVKLLIRLTNEGSDLARPPHHRPPDEAVHELPTDPRRYRCCRQSRLQHGDRLPD